MPTSNAKQNSRSEDLVWVLLAELSVRDFLSDHDRKEKSKAGYLFQTVRELGMPLGCVQDIAMLVTEFTKESPVHDEQEGLEFPGRIRIFCQKKIIDDANAARTTSRPYHTEQPMEPSPMILDVGAKMDGGWGCFLLRRGGNVSDDASLRSDHFVDLYLYREG
jgi:hypothetical protein